ncbi:MAG: hypothetical protein H0W76_13345 [Pyrinomonadaceae bacterium]|nr:hypothetical protein [Pyrinomonadaceae bacterium]
MKRKNFDVYKRKLRRVPPLAVVLCVALFVVGLPFVVRLLTVERVVAHVNFDETNMRRDNRGRSVALPSSGKLADGVMYRTADRTRDATSLALALGLSRMSDYASGRPAPASVDDLLRQVAERGLMPPGLSLPPEAGRESSGVVASERATIYVRYRVAPFGVEIVSVGSTRGDGTALLVRLPSEAAPRASKSSLDGEDEAAGVSLFISTTISRVEVPPPFCSVADMDARGWTLEPAREVAVAPSRFAELQQWLRRSR